MAALFLPQVLRFITETDIPKEEFHDVEINKADSIAT